MSLSSARKGRKRPVRFSAPTPLPRPQRKPPPSLAALKAASRRYIDSARDPSTVVGYRSLVRNHWLPFLRIYNLPLRPSLDSLLLFVPFLAGRLARPDGMFSALSWFYKLRMKGWAKLRGHPLLGAALDGFKKLHPHKTRRSPPVLPSHILAFASAALAPLCIVR